MYMPFLVSQESEKCSFFWTIHQKNNSTDTLLANVMINPGIAQTPLFSQTWGCKWPAFAVSVGFKLYLTMMTLEFGIAQLYSILENTSRYSRAGNKNDINRAETTKNREIHLRCPNCQFQRCDLTPVAGRSQTCEGHVSQRSHNAHAPW